MSKILVSVQGHKNIHTITNPFDATEQKRKTDFLRFCCIILTIIEVLGIITTIATFLAGTTIQVLPAIISCLISIALFFTAYKLAIKGQTRLSSWLVIGMLLLSSCATYLQISTATPLMIGFLLPIVLSIILLEVWETVLVTAIALVYSFSMYLVQDFLKLYKPDAQADLISNIFHNLIVVPILVALLVIPARGQAKALKEQNRQLQAALAEIQARQNASEKVSHEVLGLAAELKTTAGQQASDSQEQVATVTQVNASVSELSTTAANIAELVEQVNHAAGLVACDSQRIEDTTNLVAGQSQEGRAAVGRTVAVSSELAEFYRQLLETMRELNTKNSNMHQILKLLSSIAQETHLLALNAAIEAAGAGEYGERFSIVAHEVKSLAARSSKASKDVVQIVREIEEVTANAVVAAETGFIKTEQMKEVAGQAGSVIEQMRTVSEQSQQQASSINQAVQEVKQLCEVIKVATSQQRTASQQVLSALNNLSTAAQEAAAGINVISATAVDLENVSHNLIITDLPAKAEPLTGGARLVLAA